MGAADWLKVSQPAGNLFQKENVIFNIFSTFKI